MAAILMVEWKVRSSMGSEEVRIGSSTMLRDCVKSEEKTT